MEELYNNLTNIIRDISIEDNKIKFNFDNKDYLIVYRESSSVNCCALFCNGTCIIHDLDYLQITVIKAFCYNDLENIVAEKIKCGIEIWNKIPINLVINNNGNYKSTLQELCQKRRWTIPRYIKINGNPHNIGIQSYNIPMFSAVANNKKKAEELCSLMALKFLEYKNKNR